MTIINNDVRLLVTLEIDPDSLRRALVYTARSIRIQTHLETQLGGHWILLGAYQSNLIPRDWGLPDAMSEHAKAEKWQSDRPGEKNST